MHLNYWIAAAIQEGERGNLLDYKKRFPCNANKKPAEMHRGSQIGL